MLNQDLRKETLRQSEEQHHRMVEEIEDYAIILLDRDGYIQNWNKGAEKIKGYKPEEIIGKNFRQFYTEGDRRDHLPERLLNQAVENGRATHEGWRVRKDGTLFWGNIVITALHDDTGDVVGFTKVTRDLTERKKAEDQQAEYTRNLAETNEALRRSEERYHKMVEEVRDYAILLMDKDGNIQNWNKGAENIKGYKSEEIIGKNFRQFYTEEDRKNKLPERLLNEAVRSGRAIHEGWRVRKDGTLFWGYIVITALHNDDGDVIGFTKVTRDLTERKKAEDKQAEYTRNLAETNEALRRSEERYHKMVEEVRDYAILLLDREGNIQNWNSGAEQIKGYKASEVIGKSFKIFYFPEDIADGLPERLLQTAVEQGRATHEGWRKRKDGTRFWGSIVITALHDKNNNIIGFSKVTRDLTEQKLADDRLKKYAHQLELKNQELEEFAYVASHDLKEPLRKILTFGDLLHHSCKESVDEKAGMYITRMREAAHRMMSLIDDLLLFSRVDNDDDTFELIDLNTIVDTVIQDLEPAIKQKNAKIQVDDLPSIKARPLQLQQLFQNLIGNALKFNDKAEPVITITNAVIEPDETKRVKHCRIVVSDNGIGFDNEHKGRIFEIFQRLHGRSQYSGSGIGLAICKKIVENHNGHIEAVGEEGKGASFIITLPC